MRRHGRVAGAGFALLLALIGTAASAADPASITVSVAPGGQPHIPVRIKNAELDIRLALSFDSVLILNSGPAARAELRAFPLIGKRTFKNSLIPGGEATFRGNLYSIEPRGLPKSSLPAIWVDKPIAGDADGVLPVSVLKADRIVIDLGPQAPNAKLYSITRKNGGSAMMRARIGDENVDVALELNAADTVMNARAAALLAAAGLVKRGGEVGYWKPFPGVALPVERLTPTPGAELLGLPLRRPGARVTEAQARVIDAQARAGTSTTEDDDDTITVTAKRSRGRGPWILIGRDVLSSCSRIEFDRPGKVWHLTCAF